MAVPVACGPLADGSLTVPGIQPSPDFAPYAMDVVAKKDGVSSAIASKKMWDERKTKMLADEFPRLHAQNGRKPILLDIGANLGWFTLLAAASGHARVIAVEASSSNAAKLERSLCLNGGNFTKHVKLHKVGVGATTAECALVARRNNIASPAVVCGESDPAAFMNKWGASRRFTDYVVTGTMHMTRIDDLVTSRVDVIKIDVEGHELEVAKGWSALFDRSPPSLVLTEYVPSLIAKTSNTTQPLDYLRFFLQRGYAIEGSAGDSIATTEAQLVRWSPRWMNDLVMRRARARVPQ
uniref:Methyltransferase FkbM domain-containing protein n=1 Tax=Emiliania huxleyi TaxID=2903 RepID=A0A7S3WBH0_EMIHU